MEVMDRQKVKISVRNLVEFILRSGDIDNRIAAQDKDAMQMGAKLHRKIQRRMGASYHPEVTLRRVVEFDTFDIQVEGRADGIIEEERIYSLKSASSLLLFFFFLYPRFICAKNERMFDIIIQTHVRFVNTRFSFFWISKYLCPLYNPVICFRRQTVDQNIKNCKSQIYTNCTIPVQLCILHIECFQKISDHWKCNCHMHTRCH